MSKPGTVSLTVPLLDIGSIIRESTYNAQAFTTVHGLDMEIRPVGYKFPLLVGPAMTIPLLDIAPVCLTSIGNIQAFAAIEAVTAKTILEKMGILS